MYRPTGTVLKASVSEIAVETESIRKISTVLPDVFELRPNVIRDERGFFMETYHREKLASLGIGDMFVQDNHSSSVNGVLRGLHYQLRRPQAKLCRVVEGEAMDVAVDIRRGSPNFGKWASVLLSAELQNQVYIPAGLAHGFVALSKTVQFLYKCSDFYDRSDEYGIVWDDPDLDIAWDISNPLVCARDMKHPRLADVRPELLPRYSGT